MVSKHDHYMVHFWLGLASGLCGFTILFHSLHHFNLFPLVSFRIISMIWWLPNHHHHQHASSSHTSYQWLIYNVVSFSLPPYANRITSTRPQHMSCWVSMGDDGSGVWCVWWWTVTHYHEALFHSFVLLNGGDYWWITWERRWWDWIGFVLSIRPYLCGGHNPLPYHHHFVF